MICRLVLFWPETRLVWPDWAKFDIAKSLAFTPCSKMVVCPCSSFCKYKHEIWWKLIFHLKGLNLAHNRMQHGACGSGAAGETCQPCTSHMIEIVMPLLLGAKLVAVTCNSVEIYILGICFGYLFWYLFERCFYPADLSDIFVYPVYLLYHISAGNYNKYYIYKDYYWRMCMDMCQDMYGYNTNPWISW
jgi:hypothetical protein